MMNKALRNKLAILVVVCAVAIVAVYQARRGEAPEPVAVEDARVVVAKILEPRTPPPEPVELSTLEFAAVPALEPIGEPTPEPEAPPGVVREAVPRVRVSAKQALAVVNGVPLTGEQLMPPGRFGKSGSVEMSPEVLEQVLERSIQRELILQEADVQGIALSERDLKQLEDTYRHLTSNPLNMQGGGEVTDLNVRGDQEDAEFHVRDKAARLLQVEFLKQAGEPDTAEARKAFRDRLRSAATIETVSIEPPEGE